MLNLHKSKQRGSFEMGWLKTSYSFSFSNYFNRKRMGFGALRVLNDDIIAAGKGFGMHPHDNMEIVTIVMDGILEHKDSIGSVGVLKPGDVQVMSAGRGIVHSEYNHSKKDSVSLFQLWIQTKEQDIEPRYDQKHFDDALYQNKLHIVASGMKNAKNDSLYIHQDATVSLGNFDKGKSFMCHLENARGAFLFIIEGEAVSNGTHLHSRDSLEVSDEKSFLVEFLKDSKILLIEVPMIE